MTSHTQQKQFNPEKTKHGQLLLSGVGSGKTWMFLGLIRRLRDMNFHRQVGCISPWPFIVVTKASIVEQTRRVAKQCFNLSHPRDILIINIEKLRSKFGELFVEEITKVENGVEYTIWKWRDGLYPCMICWDECQILMNPSSAQHKIAASYNELRDTWQIFSSATPFTRVSGAKCFCVSTRKKTRVASFNQVELNNDNWNIFAKAVASPADPMEHSPAAIDRLMDEMDDYVVRVKGIKAQFHAKNDARLIHFRTKEGKEFYDKALERFEKRKAKIAASNMDEGAKAINMLVSMLMFRIAAESNPDRIDWLCEQMYHSVTEGYAAICAVNFKQTIIACVKKLNEKYGVKRNNISLIWGGGQTGPSEKQKAKAAMVGDEAIMAALAKHGITMDKLDMEDVDALAEKEELDPELRLGTQSLAERQKEIDKFQSGKSLYAFYTFKAGGVGLSLHHTDEHCTDWNRKAAGFDDWFKIINALPEKQRPKPGKTRRKESGYAVEEDIPYIPTRQRRTFLAPTWSAVELVQGLGRAPRLTSLSDTPQVLVFFHGTIEAHVHAIVSVKLHCLTKVVRQRESWEDVMKKSYNETEIKQKYLNDADMPVTTDEDEILELPSEDEDEETED